MALRGEPAIEMEISDDSGLLMATKWNRATIEDGMRLGASDSGSVVVMLVQDL